MLIRMRAPEACEACSKARHRHEHLKPYRGFASPSFDPQFFQFRAEILHSSFHTARIPVTHSFQSYLEGPWCLFGSFPPHAARTSRPPVGAVAAEPLGSTRAVTRPARWEPPRLQRLAMEPLDTQHLGFGLGVETVSEQTASAKGGERTGEERVKGNVLGERGELD